MEAKCNYTPATCAELTQTLIAQGRAEERLDNLEVWQKAQNGHLKSIDERLDRFLWFLVSILAASVGTLFVAVFRLITK
jgi:hypothetical protein